MPKKNDILKIVNPFLFLSALFQVITIIDLNFFSASLFGYHKINGYILGGLVLLHIILNWGWIANSYFKFKKKK